MDPTRSAEKPDQTEETEIELVAAAQRDPTAFQKLYERHARSIYRYLYSRVRDASVAEDLTSQVFLQALEHLGKFRNQGSFKAWLFAIAHSRAMDYYRKAGRELLYAELDPVTGDPDLLAASDRRDAVLLMRAKIGTLPEKDQELIRLRFVAGLGFAEIGAVVHRSEGAVKKAIYRLLEQLRLQMEDRHV